MDVPAPTPPPPFPYAGETRCQASYKNSGQKCREWARYYNTGGGPRLICGIHSRKGKREPLATNPRADAIRTEQVQQRLRDADALATQRALAAGGAPIAPLVSAAPFPGMRREYSFVPAPGYMPIFPNNKHGHAFGYGRGFDASCLSPMKLGPVRHGQPGLPDALSIENYHQWGKVFPNEVQQGVPCECARAAEWAHFKPAPAFYEARNAAYVDPVPHRHKFPSKELKEMNKDYVKSVNGSKASINAPMFSVHLTPAGEERHYTYVESRYFYCHAMETLILNTRAAHWAHLQQLLARGYALQIVGYDAYTPTGTDADSLYAHYCDGSRPFGHEMVILAMLVLPQADQLPWRRYRAQHARIYE